MTECPEWRPCGAVFFGPAGCDSLWAESPEEWLLEEFSGFEDEEVARAEIGDGVEVCAFAYGSIESGDVQAAADIATEAAVESLWSDFGDPSEHCRRFIPESERERLVEGIAAVLQTAVPHAKVWVCEIIDSRTYTADEIIALLKEEGELR